MNSRTPDIGKARCPALRHPLVAGLKISSFWGIEDTWDEGKILLAGYLYSYKCFTNLPSIPTCSLLTTKAWGSRTRSLRFRAESSCLEITVKMMLVVFSV